MAHYEIEIKTLLGVKEQADALVEKMKQLDENVAVTGTNKQLNHYFIDGDVEKLYQLLTPFLSEQQQNMFREILEKGKDFSISSRQRRRSTPGHKGRSRWWD